MEGRGFASRLGFIMSMAAFCIGIGNMWKFPYIVGQYGGGAFLLVYVILTLIIGVPTFLMEVVLGRSSQLSPIKGMAVLEGKKKSGWQAIGWLETIAISCICIFSGTVIGGWSLGYVFKVVSGSLSDMGAAELGATFGEFSGSPSAIIFTFACAILLWLSLNGGVKKGVEKICSILMPTLLVIMIILAIYSNTRAGAFEGLKWYLTPDFSKINLGVIGAAATQVYFSIGIGMLVAFVYGSYIDKKTALPSSLTLTALMDTAVAFLAGLVITPALFAFDIEPTAGPPLIFISLPQLFNEMGGFGRIFGSVFMLCVFAAGFSSMLGGCEALVATLCDASEKLSRKKATSIVVIAVTILSIPVTLSFGNTSFAEIKIFGFGIFDFLDFISSGVCMPIVAILIYVYCIYRWGWKKFQEEVNAGVPEGKMKIGNGMALYFKYILPVLLVFACFCVLNTYLGFVQL